MASWLDRLLNRQPADAVTPGFDRSPVPYDWSNVDQYGSDPEPLSSPEDEAQLRFPQYGSVDNTSAVMNFPQYGSRPQSSMPDGNLQSVDALTREAQQQLAKKPPSLTRQILGTVAGRLAGPSIGQLITDPAESQFAQRMNTYKPWVAADEARARIQADIANKASLIANRGLTNDARLLQRQAAVADEERKRRTEQNEWSKNGNLIIPPPPDRYSQTAPLAVDEPLPLSSPEAQSSIPLDLMPQRQIQSPPVNLAAPPEVPPGYLQAPGASYDPQGSIRAQITPSEKTRQEKQSAADIASINDVPLPSNVAQAFGLPPDVKVDPEKALPAYLNAYTALQNAQNKTLPQQVEERTAIAEQLGLPPRDRQSYIATGKFAEYPPASNNGNAEQNTLDREAARFAKAHEKAVADASGQLDKIADARSMIMGNAEAQALGIPKVLTALVSGAGSGVRITKPELNAIATARGVTGSVEGWLNSISGKGQLSATQQQQLAQILDDVRERVLQKQAIANGALDGINSAGSKPEIVRIDKEARQKLVDMEKGRAASGGSGKVRVKRKADGATGTVDSKDFDPAKYDKL